MSDAFREAAQARQASVRAKDRPSQRRSSECGGGRTAATRLALLPQQVREVQRNGMTGVMVGGLASVTEKPYEMYDMFGPYNEVVSLGAFDQTLAQSPLVEFTVNHGAGGGLPMASTRNGTLTLTARKDGEPTGLDYEAFVDPQRADVATMLLAIERGDLAEASFKFRIDSGIWSPDYTEFRIDAADLNRGDVSAVNYGANPAATSTLRSVMDKLQQGRALDAPDVNVLTQALGWFSAIDSIVDEAQEALAEYLSVPNPDSDDMAELSSSRPQSMRDLIPDDL